MSFRSPNLPQKRHRTRNRSLSFEPPLEAFRIPPLWSSDLPQFLPASSSLAGLSDFDQRHPAPGELRELGFNRSSEAGIRVHQQEWITTFVIVCGIQLSSEKEWIFKTRINVKSLAMNKEARQKHVLYYSIHMTLAAAELTDPDEVWPVVPGAGVVE